ncbi:MAG: hypothetical protein AAFR17_14980 [Pseudomonadota bacterium]
MTGSLFAALLGFVALGVAGFIWIQRQARLEEAVPAPLRAIGLEEREGQDGETWFYIVYEVDEGPHAGRHMVSELGHGGRPRVPKEVRTELILPRSGKVMTRGARRLTAVMALVFGAAGVIAVISAIVLALPKPA